MYLIEFDISKIANKNYNIALTILEEYEFRKLNNNFYLPLNTWNDVKYQFLDKKKFKKARAGLVKAVSKNGKSNLEIVYQLSELLTPEFDEMERFIYEQA